MILYSSATCNKLIYFVLSIFRRKILAKPPEIYIFDANCFHYVSQKKPKTNFCWQHTIVIFLFDIFLLGK